MVLVKTLLVLLLASCAIAAPLSSVKLPSDHATVDEDVKMTPTREQLLAILGAPAPEPNASHKHATTTPSIHRRTLSANAVTAARVRHGLTQAQLARVLGVSVATISSIETGRMAISASLGIAISHALGIR
jgi:DNA-binding XRE family transcriptional regulator